MKKVNSLLLFVLIVMLMTACESDTEGHVHLSWFGWFLIFIFIISIVGQIVSDNKSSRKTGEKLKEYGLSFDSFIRTGLYVSGHPMIDIQIKDSCIFKRGSDLVICDYKTTTSLFDAEKFSKENHVIPIDNIKNILIEDSSTIENRITMGECCWLEYLR